jgi:hypothetical protein
VQHGVKRVRNPPTVDDAAVQAKKREKELKRIAEYKGLIKELQTKVRTLPVLPSVREEREVDSEMRRESFVSVLTAGRGRLMTLSSAGDS